MDITFGDRLRLRRAELNMSQSNVADIIGLGAAAISKYEKNAASPNVETLCKLCDLLMVSADWLLGLSDIEFIDERAITDPIVERVLSLTESQRNRLHGYLDALTS
jgi:Predicted transcriptional regulators